MSTPTYGELRSRTEKYVDERIKERVLAGLEVLQEKFGDEWVEKIDCATLDLQLGDRCVLGQVYGSYADGYYALNEFADENEHEHWGVSHGFWADELAYEPPISAWYALDDAWHEVLCDGKKEAS